MTTLLLFCSHFDTDQESRFKVKVAVVRNLFSKTRGNVELVWILNQREPGTARPFEQARKIAKAVEVLKTVHGA